MKIISWNVNGIRAAVKKGFVEKFYDLDADVFCVQETKAQSYQTSEALEVIEGYHMYHLHAEKKGYSGVTVLSREKAISITEGIGQQEHDSEGRVLTLEYKDFYLVNVYVPNSGAGLKRLDYRKTWDEAFLSFLNDLKNKKNVIATGDFNVAHQAIDLARPESNYNKTSGYTQVEIDGMQTFLDHGFVDTFRTLHPDKVQYSFWSARQRARENNVGWRIDYFLVSAPLLNSVKDSFILDQVMGSDHCPIVLELS